MGANKSLFYLAPVTNLLTGHARNRHRSRKFSWGFKPRWVQQSFTHTLENQGRGGVRACWRTDKHIFQLLSCTHLDCSYGLYSGYTAGIVLLSIQVLAFTIVSIIAHTYPQDFLRKTVFYTVHVYCFWHLYMLLLKMNRIMRKPAFCICVNKEADNCRISCTVTMQLISAFVFTTQTTIPLLPKSEILSL